MLRRVYFSVMALFPCLCAGTVNGEQQWESIFNGKDLDGWVPKISGYPVGEDPLKTFIVKDGYLTVSYKNYTDFNERFGHLFYQSRLSHYKLRFSYRFIGTQVTGGAKWAYKNSGVMLHGQAPASMSLKQAFPISIEAQLLGADEGMVRPTANVCTPGTNVVIDGQPTTKHCNNSHAKTYPGEQWVQVEFEVMGGQGIKHWVNGELVLQYSGPVLDDADSEHPSTLDSGYISLQSESHPVQFKNIELLNLSGN